jgi:hypothetical protein
MGAVAAMLAERIEELATALVGAAPTDRHRGELRFRRRRSLRVVTAGPRRGVWSDHDPPPGGRPPGPKGAAGGDALDLVAHLRGCGRYEAFRWALAWLGEAPHARFEAAPPRPAASAPVAHGSSVPATLGFARRIWGEAVPAAGTLVEAYLASRHGLRLPADAPLRFHPECPRGPDERWPAMLALMTDPLTGEPRGVHRTFLARDGSGKAPGPMPAKMMAGAAGVVRLVPDEEVTLGLGIAEGIETALAVMQHFDWRPVWAACSAGGIAAFPALPGIGCLTVFADADGAGMGAARGCCRRWSGTGVEARLLAPPAGDWNDDAPPGAGQAA